jgi:hypothetical protein
MSKVIGDNYSYGGAQPNFERDSFKTVSAMTAYANEGKLDTGHICYITDEKKHYKWTDDGAVPFGGGSITLGSGLGEDVNGALTIALSPDLYNFYTAENALTLNSQGAGVFVHRYYFNGHSSDFSGGQSPLRLMRLSTKNDNEEFNIYGLALVLSEDFTTVDLADGTYGLALAEGAGGGGSAKVDPNGGLKYDSAYGLGILTKGCLKTEYGIGLSLKLDTYSGLTVDSGALKLDTPGPGLTLTEDYGLSLNLYMKGHSGLHYPDGSGYGLAIKLSENHLVGTAQSNGNPLVLDESNGLTLNLDNTLKVTNGKLGVAELPTIDVTWTNGIGQLDTDGAGNPMVGLKMGDRAGLAVSGGGSGSLYVQLPDEKIVDSAVNGSLGDWCGDYTQADTINAGGGLLRGKYGLALYLDTNYFKSAEPSEYGWGPAPITLDIAAIAQAVASVINASN